MSLVEKGFYQRPGIDYHDTFNTVIKPTIVHIISSLALFHGWPLCQLDFNHAFLHGHLVKDVYMSQPPGFIHPKYPTNVCKLKTTLYGLKHAPRAWYNELKQFLLSKGFVNAHSDTSLFIYQHGGCLYLLAYVDDLVLTWTSS